MSIGDRLREERERLNLSQSVLGQIGGVQKRAQINYEAGERSPDAAYLRGVAHIGVDVQYVLLGVRSANLEAVMISDEFVEETDRERTGEALSGQSVELLTADERQLLTLFRAASLTGKMAAVGALQGAMGSMPTQPSEGGATQNFHAPVGGGVAGRDIVNKGRK